MHQRLLAAAIILLGLPVSIHAQTLLEQGSYLISPAIGLGFDTDGHVSLAVAGAVAFTLTDSFAVEGELGHLFDLTSDDPNVDSSLTTVHGSLLFFFDAGFQAMPYVAGGFGMGRFSREVEQPPDSLDRKEVGFNLGGGLTYPLNDNIWARGDVRFFKHIDDVPSVWRLMVAVTLRLPD